MEDVNDDRIYRPVKSFIQRAGGERDETIVYLL